MNTASNWPMGSTLAQLNLELQSTPFPVGKSNTDKTIPSLTNDLKTAQTMNPKQNSDGSVNMQPLSQLNATKTRPIIEVTKWTQTR